MISAPSVSAVVNRLVTPLQGRRLPDGSCLQVTERGQEPAGTVNSGALLPPDQAPQVWVSDSTLWGARLTGWKTEQVGSLGTSAVVLAARAAADPEQSSK